MIQRLVIFLIRKKLGLKKYQKFRFTNQKSKVDEYWFTDTQLLKTEFNFYEKGILGANGTLEIRPAGVSLNWLLNDDCEITTDY